MLRSVQAKILFETSKQGRAPQDCDRLQWLVVDARAEGHDFRQHLVPGLHPSDHLRAACRGPCQLSDAVRSSTQPQVGAQWCAPPRAVCIGR